MAATGHIALLDEDEDTRTLLALALEAAGHQVTEVTSGLRLVSVLEVERPDLLIVEPGTRWIDGLAVVRALKRSERFCRLPVVFLSGRRRPADLAAGYAAGAADYFVEPVRVEALVQRVAEILAEQEEGRWTSS